MSTSFLAILSDSPPALAHLSSTVERSTGAVPLYQTSDIVLFAKSDERILEMPQDCGVILGDLFRTEGGVSSKVTYIPEDTAHHISATHGQALVDRHWGGYVAFVRNPDRTLRVVRDPSGHVPCYYYSLPGALVITSDMERLLASGLAVPDLDFDAIASFLCSADLRTEYTGFKGFSELLPGSRLHYGAGILRTSLCWSPWDYVARKGDKRPEAAALGERIRDCVRAWASSFNYVGLGLSGGLDSSIVAASLADGSTRWTPMTIITGGGDGDERAYARSVADALGVSLIEAFRDSAVPSLTKPSMPHLPRPQGNILVQSTRSIVGNLQTTRGIDAYFTGIGGDSVFCYMQSATPLIDRICWEGLGAGALNTLEDICRMTGASYGEVAGMALRRVVRGRRNQIPGKDTGFIDQHIGKLKWRPSHHVWLDAPKWALPGQAVHVLMLLRIQATIDALSGIGLPVVAPLYCQPIIEWCLGAPSWYWCAEGQNRALARSAFHDLLPPEIIRRRTKGGPDSFVIEWIEGNKTRITDFLVNGRLASHGIINREALASVLLRPGGVEPPAHIHIADLIEAEAWVAHWSDRLSASPLRSVA